MSPRLKHYNENRRISDKYNHIWEKCIKEWFPGKEFRYATIDEDTKHCIDVVIDERVKVSLKVRILEKVYSDVTVRDIEVHKWGCAEYWNVCVDSKGKVLRLMRIDAKIFNAEFIKKNYTQKIVDNRNQEGFAYAVPISRIPKNAIKFYWKR